MEDCGPTGSGGHKKKRDVKSVASDREKKREMWNQRSASISDATHQYWKKKSSSQSTNKVHEDEGGRFINGKATQSVKEKWVKEKMVTIWKDETKFDGGALYGGQQCQKRRQKSRGEIGTRDEQEADDIGAGGILVKMGSLKKKRGKYPKRIGANGQC